MKRTISARKLALLLLLRAADSRGNSAQPIVGITRLQKLMFLVWKRLPKMSPDRDVTVDFEYTAQRYGPADSGLYADLEFLTALRHIRRGTDIPPDLLARVDEIDAAQLNLDDLLGTVASEATQPGSESDVSLEEATEDELSFEYLMGGEEIAADFAAGERIEDSFAITETGIALLNEIELRLDRTGSRTYQAIAKATAEVRVNFGEWPLPKLLRHVYTQYPDMTVESEIKRRVLGGDY